MTRNKKPSAADIALFRDQVGEVNRLRHDKAQHPRKPLPPRPRRHTSPPHRLPGDRFSDLWDAGTVGPEDKLFFARPGLQQRQLQRLRRGQLVLGYLLSAAAVAVILSVVVRGDTNRNGFRLTMPPRQLELETTSLL